MKDVLLTRTERSNLTRKNNLGKEPPLLISKLNLKPVQPTDDEVRQALY